MVAWTLFHNCFAVHVFMTKFSSLFRKMPTALLGTTRQKLYSKGVLEWSEINEYRIPAVLMDYFPYMLLLLTLDYTCETLVQLWVSSRTVGTQPIVPARKNKAMWPGKCSATTAEHGLLLSAGAAAQPRHLMQLPARPLLFPFPHGTSQSDTAPVLQECFHNPFAAVTEPGKHLLLTATICWFQRENVIWRDCIQKILIYPSIHFSRC